MTQARQPRTGSFEDRLIQVVESQPRVFVIPLFLTLLFVAGMASRTSSFAAVAAWFGAAVAILLIRLYLQVSRRLERLPASSRLRATVVLVALSGIAHGSSLVFFPQMSSFEQAVLSMTLIALAAGSVATAAGYKPIFLSYVLPTLLPLSIMWAVTPALRDVSWVQGLMSLLILTFIYVLNSLASATFSTLEESFSGDVELAAALKAEASANRAKTRFLASASHDLRQPMQTLSLFAAALAMRPLDPRSQAMVAHINEALQDLTSELDALLDISKLDAGTVKPQAAPFALRPLLERVTEVFSPAATEKGLAWKLNCDPDLWVFTDRKLLERICRNLVENAIKYTSAGRVAVAAQTSAPGTSGATGSRRCILSIADTGCGIAAAEQERVFEEFYQVDNPGRDRRLGLGLGLSIVKRTADLLGLHLEMDSAPGVGTTFRLMLPVAEPTDADASVTETPALQPSTRLRVLLIDDEEGVRRALEALLHEMGLEVELAGSSADALAIPPDRYDVVIADFRLRDGDSGVQAIRTLRATRDDLPAILMTGETAPEHLIEAQSLGLPILHKPVASRQLMSELARVLIPQEARDGRSNDASS